jgi:transposase IS66 family protein
VKVLDVKLPFARTGRIWPYYGDPNHPVVLYDYTATRECAGPEKFLEGYRGYLQADAYGGYDAFFKDPARGLVEVGCWAHARRYFHKALESDQPHMEQHCCWSPSSIGWNRRHACRLRQTGLGCANSNHGPFWINYMTNW